MTTNKELLGLKLEIAGLLMVLAATVWQGSFTDWFDRSNQNWVALTQESVNFAVLGSFQDLSRLVSEPDAEQRRKLEDQIQERTGRAYTDAITERNRRLALQSGQASTFGSIRYTLLLLGAALVIVGKWLVHAHKASSHVQANSLIGRSEGSEPSQLNQVDQR